MKILIAAALALSALAIGSTAPAAAEGQTKATVCHVEGNENVIAISIADPAVQSHIDHGDSRPGDAAGPGLVFADDCSVIDAPDVETPFTIACDSLNTAVMGVTGTVTGPQSCDLTGVVKENRAEVISILRTACFSQMGAVGFSLSLIEPQTSSCQLA